MSSSEPNTRDIFAEALRLTDPAERAAYLDRVCAGNPARRQDVESLLAANDKAGDFLKHTIRLPEPDIAIEHAGTRIGRYKLLEQVGEGGFGVVWMAEQEEPVRRRVALKIIKLGMDTKEVVARFEAERQALALMDHPNIAGVFDGGATETGRPYFVMELVKGIPITRFCDERKLTTEERLELFMQVCHAVQHAHQKGIIHRDLKPSNILVTVRDDRPVPKVIDFGVAKATQARLTQKTLFTRLQQWIGTPAYMSPEQAGLGSLDVDTRSDIYSLGVLLYELLTGQTPFDAEKLLATGYEAVMRTIREEEPPKPSTRISTLAEEELKAVAARRGEEPAKLGRLVRGDLDWIVMKCLEKDRARRYETANNVALDIDRYLSHEPVSAAAPSTIYLARKFIRRHKVGLAMAGGMALLLAGGVVVSRLQAIRATRAERQQALLRERAEAVVQLLKDLIQGLNLPNASGRDTRLIRELLESTLERVGQDLNGQPQVEMELRLTVGDVYRWLGDYSKAESTYRLALSISTNLWGVTNAEAAQALASIAGVLTEQGKLGDAEPLCRQALDIRVALFGWKHRGVAASLSSLAFILMSADRPDEAEPLARKAFALQAELRDATDPAYAKSLEHLARVYQKKGRLAKAEEIFRQVFMVRTNRSHTTLDNFARLLQVRGKLKEAEGIFQRVLAVRRTFLGEKHPLTAWSWNRLGLILQDQGRFEEAEIAHRRALDIRREVLGNKHNWVKDSLDNLGCVLREQGKLEEALDAETNSFKIAEELLGFPAAAIPLDHIGYCLQRQGKLAEAETVFRKVVSIWDSKSPKDWWAFSARSYLGVCLLERKKYSEAEPLLLAAYEGIKNPSRQESRERIRATLDGLVRLNSAMNRPERAAEWQQKLMEFQAVDTRPALELSPQDPERWVVRGKLLEQTGCTNEALQAFSKAIDLASGQTNGARIEALLSRCNLLKRLNRFAEAQADFLQAKNIPSRDPRASARLVDLSRYYNAAFVPNWHGDPDANDLAELPRGLRRFDGVEFDVRGIIQAPPRRSGAPPGTITNILVRQPCTQIHFLHAAIFADGLTDGIEVGRYIVHFEEGSNLVIPLRVGTELADWWHQPGAAAPRVPVAWTGLNGRARKYPGCHIRLFHLAWENPKPGVVVRSIDLVTTHGRARPFLVAMTLE